MAEPWDPVVSAGLWTYFVATLDKAQYNYCMHAAQSSYFAAAKARSGIYKKRSHESQMYERRNCDEATQFNFWEYKNLMFITVYTVCTNDS